MNRAHEATGRRSRGLVGDEVRELALRRVPVEKVAERRDPTLADLAWSVVERRWTVATVFAAALLATAAYLFVVPPIYESSVLLNVGGRARPAAPEDVVRLFDTTPHVEGEMRILQSRALLDRVIDELKLDVEARPRAAPLVGAAILRRYRGEALAPPPLDLSRFGVDLSRFAWGGERIAVDQLAVPEALVEEPLVLVALGGGRFALTVPGSGVRLSGSVGALVSEGAGARRVSLLVSELKARPGTEFLIRKLRRLDLVESLRKSLTATEQGKDAGLVELGLKGTEPAVVARTLEALAAIYVRESRQETSSEAANALKALDEQLPTLKARVDAAESALDRFHRRNGSVNLSVDGNRLMLRMGEVDRAISVAEATGAEDARRHTSLYSEAPDPARAALPRLKAERAALEAQLDALPGLEMEYTRLVRQVAGATERYTRVANRAEDLRTVKSSWTGNARIVEHAVEQRRPVSPRKGLAVALAAIVGVSGGLAAAFLRSALDVGIRDPDEIEARTGVPVFATIPRSAAQRQIVQRAGRRGRLRPLSMVEPGDAAVEDLRALRTGVEFALRRATNNVVVVGSPAPGAGKSFVSANLAHLLAAFDGRVLLVDGDLRRGVLHRYFGLEATPGVSDVLVGEATLETAVHRTEDPNLDVLPMGKHVTNPAELLASAAFRRLLEDVQGRYKTIVVDTTPVLSVTDSALIARSAGVTLFVVRAGQQNLQDVSLGLKRLVQNGATVRGAVLNDLCSTLGHYGRSGGYRRYDNRLA